MADADATIWAAIVAGVTTLIGVGLGAWLSYGAAKRINEQQSIEAKKARKISQLERLNKVLEDVHLAGLSVSSAATQTSIQKKPVQIHDFNKSGGTEDELEFLTRVYLPKSKLFAIEIRSISKSLRENLIKLFTASDLVVVDAVISEMQKLETWLADSVENLRNSIVEAAQEIEGR